MYVDALQAVTVCLVLQLLMMIGEQFEDASDEVRGAVVNIRPKGDKLALWTGHSDRREETTRIG